MELSEHAWFFDENQSIRVKVLQRSAYTSVIEFIEQGMKFSIMVSNDDIEFIGEDPLDDED